MSKEAKSKLPRDAALKRNAHTWKAWSTFSQESLITEMRTGFSYILDIFIQIWPT